MHPLLSDALLEAYATSTVECEVVNTLEVSSESAGVSPMYLCSGNVQRDFRLETSEIVTFLPVPFVFSFPSMDSSGAKELNIGIENVKGETISLLDTVRKRNAVLLVKFRSFIVEKALEGPQNNRPIIFEVSGASATTKGVTIRATVPDIVNRSFPANAYSYADYPGLRG